jgi:5-methylcytosine-specific restriction enzyme subunit McrC
LASMQIPILNIYFLLCYAWDKLEEGEKVRAGASDYRQSVDLFTRVLVNGCNRLFRLGLDRDYNMVSEKYNGVKGKINFPSSINGNLFRQGKAWCEFDEFESNILQNQILKATLLRISKVKGLDRNLYKEVVILYSRFTSVEAIELKAELFSKVRIHRNNSFYDLLLKISRYIFDSTSLNEDNGKYLFQDFVRDEKAMARLFESFLRNFYKRELTEYKVSSPKIEWMAEAVGNSDIELLPEMRTDICLESKTRKIIMDAKYYRDATAEYHGARRFNSNNLYQVYSYLRNLEVDDSSQLNKSAEGVLVYPTVDLTLDQTYSIGGHRIRLVTIDLNKDWRNIDTDLKAIVRESN